MTDPAFLSGFLTTTGLVAIAEIGDKTQLLSLLLAARFRRPWSILAGILAATLANHLLAAQLGVWIDGWLDAGVLRWVLAGSFAAMAVWTLIPDHIDDAGAMAGGTGRNAFTATLVAFFLAEIGDKTQLATTALAAHYGSVWMVAGASTLGLMLANVPAVLLGHALLALLPLSTIRYFAAAAFAAMALGVLLVG